MHSSHLRGADFTMTIDGDDTSHADFFHDFAITRRLGVVCDTPLDGLGAATLLMAAVTAFYDGYRDMGGEFFAYPDFFTFQLQSPVASYSMFDIWPDHKNVDVEPEMHTGALTGSLTDAITDRGTAPYSAIRLCLCSRRNRGGRRYHHPLRPGTTGVMGTQGHLIHRRSRSRLVCGARRGPDHAVLPQALPHRRHLPAIEQPMRIVTWNVLGLTGYPADVAAEAIDLPGDVTNCEHFASVFSGLNTDVLALQEG
jgi:hypothetical protein